MATYGQEGRTLTSSAATFSFPSGLTETTIVTFDPSQNFNFEGIFLDLSNLTQDATIRARHDLHNDGTFIALESFDWDVTDVEDGLFMSSGIPGDGDIRITIQSDVAEGASRNIPYEFFYWNLQSPV